MPLEKLKQDQFLETTVRGTLLNFSMAARITDVLINYHVEGFPPPRATVTLKGAGIPVEIVSENCGFFTNPVLQVAILDCRRTLDFFGLRGDFKSGLLKSIKLPRSWGDDIGIEDFGLPLVTRENLLVAMKETSSMPMERFLVELYHGGNKRLAHFTSSEPKMNFIAIRDMCNGLIEAWQRLAFDALKRPRLTLPNPSFGNSK